MCLSHRDEQMQQKLTDAGDLDKELQREREEGRGLTHGKDHIEGTEESGGGCREACKGVNGQRLQSRAGRL